MGLQWSYFYREVLPFLAMVFLQCTAIGLTTLFKAASDKGMSYRVFIVYSYALSAFVLLPFAYFFDRKKKLPPLSWTSVGRILLLGLLGYTAQMFGYKGIEYSSPTLCSAISNLTPAFTFVLAILFGMEKLRIKSLSGQAKIIGTIVSVTGALVAVLYAGPIVIKSSTDPTSLQSSLLKSDDWSDWMIGGLLFTADFLILSTWYIVQAQTVQKYPAELLVVALYNLAVAIIATPVTFLLEKDYSAWKFDTSIMLIAILYAGLYGSSFAIAIITWCLRMKGPFYVSLFQPLSIIISFFSILFLHEDLFLGSVIGSAIIAIGFYVVMWGKTKEENEEQPIVDSFESLSTENTMPLLQ